MENWLDSYSAFIGDHRVGCVGASIRSDSSRHVVWLRNDAILYGDTSEDKPVSRRSTRGIMRPLRFMPVCHDAEEMGEVDQCQREYTALWADGFWPFLLTNDVFSDRHETERYVVLPIRTLRLALCRIRNTPARPRLEEAYDHLWHLAARGYKAHHVGGWNAIAIAKPSTTFDVKACPFNPDFSQKNVAENYCHECGGLDKSNNGY